MACVFFGAVLSGMASDELEAKFSLAVAHFEEGKYKEAIALYNEVIEQKPDLVNVWINRAISKAQLDDYSGARADLSQALVLSPQHPDALKLRGLLRYEMGDAAGGLRDMGNAVDAKPNDALLRLTFADLLVRQEKDSEAIIQLNHAIKLEKDYVDALLLRGELLEDARDAVGAMIDADRVLALEPDNPRALILRALLTFREGEWAATVADGKRLITVDPENARAHYVLGCAQFALRDYEAAVASLDRSIGLRGDDVDRAAFATLFRHHALIRLGKPDQRLAEVWPTWSDEWVKQLAQLNLGLIGEEAIEKIVATTQDEEALKGRLCEMHFYIGLLRMHAGDRPTARLRFQASVATGKDRFYEHSLARAELGDKAFAGYASLPDEW
jgi:tetratricopeptide (TPR) repeat protein